MRQPSKYDDFWSHVDRRGPDECWLWLSTRNWFGKRFGPNTGYGQFSEYSTDHPRRQRTVRAHVRAYELGVGPRPPGARVRHTCDNPLCCNPRHLRIGTQGDNVRDSVERGRHVPGNRKITDAQAVEIYRRCAQGELQAVVGADYGLASNTVSGIVRGRRHARAVADTLQRVLEATR